MPDSMWRTPSKLVLVGAVAHLCAPVALAQTTPCEAPADTSELSRLIGDAEEAFTRLDVDAFSTATDTLAATMPCLSEQLPRSLAAEIHRYMGLKAVLSRDFDSAALAFAAARSVEPHYRFPATLVPPGNPIHDVYQQVNVGTGVAEEVPPPAQGELKFDGTSGAQRPTVWPTIVQLVNSDGAVTATIYVTPGDTMPAYEPRPEGAPDPNLLPTGPLPPKKGPRAPLLGTAVGAAVLSGAFVGLAASNEAKFWNESTPDAELPGLRSRINSFVALSAVSGTVALGTGVAGVSLSGSW